MCKLIKLQSHNFTAAAFGKFDETFTTITCKNTEFGILFPPYKCIYFLYLFHFKNSKKFIK